jgi:hypothetical protein
MERGEGPCPPDEFRERIGRRAAWGTLGWILGIPGILAALWGLLEGFALSQTAGRAAILTGQLLFTAALCCYALYKGRGPAWGLLALGCIPGWMVLAFLPSRCGWCGRAERTRRLHCAACGGPV